MSLLSLLGIKPAAKPAYLQKREELESQLQFQRQRLEVASQRALNAVKKDLDFALIVKKFPYQSALVMLVGGYLLTQKATEELQLKGPIRPKENPSPHPTPSESPGKEVPE